MSDLKVAVIGAGVVGLTTARILQQEFRNAHIEIVADRFYEDTTSYVAAGIFRPGTSFSGPTEQITRKWINNSFNYWNDLRCTSEGANAGITQVSGYIFSSQYPNIVRNSYIEDLVPIYRQATAKELKLCPGHWRYGSFFSTVLTECSFYLPWAEKKFREAGGIVTQRQIESFQDLSESNYNVIVNCSGLQAKFLCDDAKMVPIRGQVAKVHAPWIKTFFYGDYDTYIIPGINSVTLGGCRNYDSYDLTVNHYDSLSIMERCHNLVPSLKGAKLMRNHVGLRPHRDQVRVEKEIRLVRGKQMKIVHNYGHGGYGVTTAPGTGLYAVELVKEILAGNSKL